MKHQKTMQNEAHTMKNDLESRFTRIEVTMESILKSVDRIDRRLEKLDEKADSNFKWLLGLYLGGCAAILGLLARGFHWL